MFHDFRKDERGMAIVLVSIMLPVIIGFALLAIDMSRVNSLHNDLQNAADSFALAAAAELDRSSDSWARAERAMATLIDNTSTFSTAGPTTLAAGQPGGGSVCNSAGNISWCFLKSIPNEDRLPITAANRSSDPDLAKAQSETRFIEVTVNPTGFRAIFPASFLGGSNTMNVSARAVAGFTTGVCDYTPVFICNPYELEPGGVTLEAAVNSQDIRRRQILLRGNDHYMPGNFAFLKAPDGNGAKALENMLASTKPLACYAQDGVDTEPGQNAGPVKDGLNARFGLTGEYALSDGPAQNVRAGLKNVECKKGVVSKYEIETNPALGVGLERDACFPNCTSLGSTDAGMLGDGNWDFARYWSVNHQGRPVPAKFSGTKPTRYQVYRYEIDPDGNPATNDSIVSDPAVGGETGVPACGVAPISIPDRRILYGAIIDCKKMEDSGMKFSGRLEDVPVRAFGSFFITEPIKDGKDVYVELVDITGRGGLGTLDNFLRDEAQLYR